MSGIVATIDASIALIAALINSVFAVLILVRTSRATVYKTFFFICIATVIWNLGDFMVYSTGNRSWFYFSLIGTGMIPSFTLHFINALVRPEQKGAPWIIASYVLSGLLALSSPLALYIAGLRSFVDGFTWNICYFMLFIPIFLWGIIMLFRAMKQAPEDEKNRLQYIFVAMIIGFLTGMTDLVQILRLPVPPLGHLGTLAYSSVLATGVFKHRKAYDILAQIEMKMKMLSETAAGIAHEIRNPLSSIKAAAELAADHIDDGNVSKSREYMDIITEETERLNGILTDFQYFTKPLKIDKTPVYLNEVIQKTVRLSEMGMAHINIKKNLSADLPVVPADASLLKQVFLNLIKNAAEACGTGGDMTINTEYIPPYVRIDLCDNGPGLPPGVLNQIFEPFFTTKSSGTGMGLAICQRIILAHNGKIEAENMLPKGIKFSIFLPVKE